MVDTGQTVKEADIVQGLACLGVRPTACVMAHAALSQFGHVEGGARTVISALRSAAGPEGAVLIPSFRDAIRSDYYALRTCESQCPQKLCPSSEPGYTGKVGETLRQQPDALRSCHPTHSWAGVGNAAAFLLQGHRHSLTPCGSDSPFVRLLQHDGIVLLLGVDVNALTNMHVVEDLRNLPYLSAIDREHRHATYTTSGRRIQYVYPDLLHRTMVDAGILRSVKIGNASCHALTTRDLASFLWIITEDDPWCLVLRPAGNQYDPETDARRKTDRMLLSWQSNPDREAWKQLAAASKKTIDPNQFEPTDNPSTDCPAYRGILRGHHRCAANDIGPREKFEDFSAQEPGIATCQHCNWPRS